MDKLVIDIQHASSSENIPSNEDFFLWTQVALNKPHADITIRIVDEEESSHLNATYRKKQGPTNVLSFPFISPTDHLQGDLVLCAPLVNQEAISQTKPLKSHWAHLIIHGILHLQGYDHIIEADAKLMKEQEIALLLTLGIPNPYE